MMVTRPYPINKHQNVKIPDLFVTSSLRGLYQFKKKLWQLRKKNSTDCLYDDYSFPLISHNTQHTTRFDAGKAVGVRNFPDKGIKGESFLRECYEKSIADLGGCFLPQDGVCVDFGCGTG